MERFLGMRGTKPIVFSVTALPESPNPVGSCHGQSGLFFDPLLHTWWHESSQKTDSSSKYVISIVYEGGCRSDEEEGLSNSYVVCVVNALARCR